MADPTDNHAPRILPRRLFVRTCGLALGALGTGGMYGLAHGLVAPASDPEIPREIKELMASLYGRRPIRTGHVALDMPLLAEDSRVVPLIVEADLPMTPERYVKRLDIIVDYNPAPHVAGFELTPDLGGVSLSTRIKMRRTSWVRAIAETSDGELWAAYARVRVTLDGCA